jgi:hypothetical protein
MLPRGRGSTGILGRLVTPVVRPFRSRTVRWFLSSSCPGGFRRSLSGVTQVCTCDKMSAQRLKKLHFAERQKVRACVCFV